MKRRKKYKHLESAVVWYCYYCGAYNLHALDHEEFECIGCEHVLYALAHPEIFKKEIK